MRPYFASPLGARRGDRVGGLSVPFVGLAEAKAYAPPA